MNTINKRVNTWKGDPTAHFIDKVFTKRIEKQDWTKNYTLEEWYAFFLLKFWFGNINPIFSNIELELFTNYLHGDRRDFLGIIRRKLNSKLGYIQNMLPRAFDNMGVKVYHKPITHKSINEFFKLQYGGDGSYNLDYYKRYGFKDWMKEGLKKAEKEKMKNEKR